MHFKTAILLFGLVAVASALKAHHEEAEDPHMQHEEHEHDESRFEKKPQHQRHEHSSTKKEDMRILEHSSIDREHLFFQRSVEHFLANPQTQKLHQCFEKNFKPGQSIDFVIDLAVSPSLDKVDKLNAESPIGLFMERNYRSPSRAYFGSVQLFIDSVTIGMKSEWTHSIIYDKDSRSKFIIRGRESQQCDQIERLTAKGEFMDESRNLKTLFPRCTKEIVSKLGPIVKNNLGRMTKLALWSRDNGLPIVVSSERRSKPAYTVLITDGSSGAKLSDLVDDLSRTTVIDLGNHRFLDNLKWDEIRKLPGVFSLTAPQQLPLMLDTIRTMACRFLENADKL